MKWLFGNKEVNIREPRKSIALVDAANLYGAGRHLRNMHDDRDWSYREKYNRIEDERLFYDMMHMLLLYDKIIFDITSINRADWQDNIHELIDVIDTINGIAGYEHICGENAAPLRDLLPVVNAVSRLFMGCERQQEMLSISKKIQVPWYYSDHLYFDHSNFVDCFNEYNIDKSLLPLAQFMYRGIVYSGYANHYNKVESSPMAYIASAGRLQAIQPFMDSESIERLNFPRREYLDLVALLDLPSTGYDFSNFNIEIDHISCLQQVLSERDALDALRKVYEIRNSNEAENIRERWADRLWDNSQSCAVGVQSSNWISGSTIHGNVNMVYAAARNG